MSPDKERNVKGILLKTIGTSKALTFGVLVTVIGAVAAALLPPLVLERVVDRLTLGRAVPFSMAALYFGLIALTGILESGREVLLTVFGQRITRRLREALCDKLTRLPADTFVKQEPGAAVSRFVGDVDTVETLFTAGIISMAADLCKVVSILAVIFVKNRGLAVVLLFLIPVLFAFTRFVQKRMLKSQIDNRVAVAKVTNHVPETVRSIRTIHVLGKERYMCRRYGEYIDESYEAMERTNFYDSIYSPVILILNVVVTAAVLLLSASGNARIQEFFGMSVGTAVAVISYISQVFTPLESIGMEIQTIQSAVAGVHRIDEFLGMEERWETEEEVCFDRSAPCIELKNVNFQYEKDKEILREVSLSVEAGEQITLAGRTGVGKSTVFKLILGLYRPQEGKVLVYGQEAERLPDSVKRRIFGYVEQSFRMVPGTVADQITLFDEGISQEQVEKAAKLVGLHESICGLEKGYRTVCRPELFSQGQWQLLSIARAIVSQPEILLLDEITTNLDAETEQAVLRALGCAAENRTVLSISHRLYERNGGRLVFLGAQGDACQPIENS
ncbi:MAG: ABC transporter ATP-binding protein [Eubacteriales bacterium]|nr:ABC transporter ATP-binding protein [Eubacteriales bacterium]